MTTITACRTLRTVAFCGLVWLTAAMAVGQPPQGSLTDDFPGLSAKERSRIAKQEEGEAKADTAYQRLMARGEDLFREARYTDALAVFQEARAKRPYNVYPKVKIHDLEALIKRQQEQQALRTESAPQAPAAPVEKAPEPMPVAPSAPPVAPAVAPVPVVERTAPARPATPTTAPSVHKPVAAPTTGTTTTVAPTVPPPDGMQERQYKEGNAFVTERTVTEGGHSTVYRKVVHSWATYHFKDGKAIDERVWKERFGGR